MNGQLGLPGIENTFTFSKVHSCENVRVQKVFAGGDHSFILLNHNLNFDEVFVPDDEIVVEDVNLL
jgi:alpha-tubulin suppressor-like RCC1 family protein